MPCPGNANSWVWIRIFIPGPPLPHALSSMAGQCPRRPLAIIVNLEHWDWEVPARHAAACRAAWVAQKARGPATSRPFRISAATAITSMVTGSGFSGFWAALDKHATSNLFWLFTNIADNYPFLIHAAGGATLSSSRTALPAARSSTPACRRKMNASISARRSKRSRRPRASARSVGPGLTSKKLPNTPNLLAAEGIRYVRDWGNVNTSSSYKMTLSRTGELYSLGVNQYLDDNYIHIHGRRTINEVNLLWRDWFGSVFTPTARPRAA